MTEHNNLLYEQESETLDFKSQQYPFVGADEYQKSEILKDILAFANAWRRTEAFILIGIREVPGGKHDVVGIHEELDDASLQQFVRSKIQKSITFNYQTIPMEGKKIGLIRIPVQDRPIYLTKKYGKLLPNIVYIRRGTATLEATPEEIAAIGRESSASQQLTKLTVELIAPKDRASLGVETSFDATILEFPEKDAIPDYKEYSNSPFGDIYRIPAHVNSDYYRELFNYYDFALRSIKLGFSVQNASDMLASDVRVEFYVPIRNDFYSIVAEADRPDSPVKQDFLLHNITPLAEQLKAHRSTPEIIVRKLNEHWMIEVFFSKVQPKQTAYTDESFFFLASSKCDIEIRALIFADNLSSPLEQQLLIHASASTKQVTLDGLDRAYRASRSRSK